jgi:DNA-binding response OmpR family regulator
VSCLRIIIVTPSLVASDADEGELARILRALGHEVQSVAFPSWALDQYDSRADIAVVLSRARLDVMREAIACLRAHPVLGSAQILAGLELAGISMLRQEDGADDFIRMPFNSTEIGVRMVQLVMRGQNGQRRAAIQYGEISLDYEARDALHRGRSLKLSPYEFRLLRFLVERPGRAFSREELLLRVFDSRVMSRVKIVDSHLNLLRSKLGPLREIIQSVRGFGYKLVWPDDTRQRAREEAPRRYLHATS